MHRRILELRRWRANLNQKKLIKDVRTVFDCDTATCPHHHHAFKKNCDYNGLRASGRR